jgi:hypothetical protein
MRSVDSAAAGANGIPADYRPTLRKSRIRRSERTWAEKALHGEKLPASTQTPLPFDFAGIERRLAANRAEGEAKQLPEVLVDAERCA